MYQRECDWEPYLQIPEDGESPTDLIYARSHAELKGRKERPVSEGLSLREKLNTKDYSNTE
jgi:hypothetical protein